VNRFRLAAVCVGVLLLALPLLVPAAHADGVYHSHHYGVSPLNGAPLRSGFVENIHPNGSQVFAHENYVLNGASPGTSYIVVLSIWTSNQTCSGAPDLQFPTQVVATNSAGNGKAQHVFTPEDATGLRGLTLGGVWQFLDGGVPSYTTDCEVVTLD
jgi:hypothetical protein